MVGSTHILIMLAALAACSTPSTPEVMTTALSKTFNAPFYELTELSTANLNQ